MAEGRTDWPSGSVAAQHGVGCICHGDDCVDFDFVSMVLEWNEIKDSVDRACPFAAGQSINSG